MQVRNYNPYRNIAISKIEVFKIVSLKLKLLGVLAASNLVTSVNSLLTGKIKLLATRAPNRFF